MKRLSLLLFAFTASLLLAVGVSGCGSAGQGASASNQSGTHKVTDANGKQVEIPIAPRRIVTLSEPSLDGALALGIKPVGTTSGRGQKGPSSYLAKKAAGIPVVASVKTPNLEQILKLDPDLIIVDDTTGARNSMAELGKIAPTIWAGNTKKGWKAYFDALAAVLNKKTQAQAVQQQIQQKIAAAKAGLAGRTKLTASVVRWTDAGPTITGGNTLASWALNQVGVSRPANQQNVNSQNRSGVTVSLEQLNLIDADYLFFGVLGNAQDSTAALAKARALPNFSALQAVRGGHVKAVDGTAWTSSSGPLGLTVILDDIAATIK